MGPSAGGSVSRRMNSVRFAVFTDLHFDHIPDGRRRTEDFAACARKANVDFVIQLGDFCSPKDENRVLLDILDGIGKPHYHLIGNHESDRFSKDEVLRFLHMERSFYSFCFGGVKFIALDTCFIQTEDGYVPYCKRNYKGVGGVHPVLPDDQFAWLKSQFTNDHSCYVIFSHHSLENEYPGRGVFNRDAVRNVIDEANRAGHKVLLSINGHDHGDSLRKIGETHYFGLNSMSYIWLGPQYEHFCYSSEIHQQYPVLKDVVLYREGLFGIITIAEEGRIEIQGMTGHYRDISPRELGLGQWNGRPLLPVVSSLAAGQGRI